jgi:Domain of unknown function (DUF4034)
MFIAACGESRDTGEPSASEQNPERKAKQKVVAPWTHTSPQENISVAEIEENSKFEIITETTADREAAETRAKVIPLVESGDFDALDKMAAAFLKTRSRDADGGWKLADFYSAFELKDKASTPFWTKRLDFLQRWTKAKPGSQTARIALADFYKCYAWRARGSGYADTVTKEGWRLMGERLEMADEILGGAKESMKITDPMFYQVALSVMLGSGGPPSVFDGLVTSSLETAPDFWGSLSVRAYSLVPRWYGETGDWEAFAKYIAEKNEPFGKEQYAFIVFQRHAYDLNAVDVKRLDWNLLKAGIREVLKKYPNSETNLSRAAFIATLANDREFAKECFDLLGDRCVPKVWLVNGRMCHYRNWARTGKW